MAVIIIFNGKYISADKKLIERKYEVNRDDMYGQDEGGKIVNIIALESQVPGNKDGDARKIALYCTRWQYFILKQLERSRRKKEMSSFSLNDVFSGLKVSM